MRVLLYEHISSGGLATEPLPAGLLCEGYAMLRGLAEDFKAAGHNVTMLLDSRISAFHPPLAADCIVEISGKGQADRTIEKAAKTVDAAYVVAPEPKHVLQSIVECIESTGTQSLNCHSWGIEQVSEKEKVLSMVTNQGLAFPKTLTFSADDSLSYVASEIASKLTYPVVVKPTCSAGCSGLSLTQNETQLTQAIAKVKAEPFCNDFVIQQYIKGIPASVSLLSNGEEATPVSLNLQDITLAGPDGASSYNGGRVPLEHPLKVKAFKAAKQVVERFKGLRGYVGVDVVLGLDGVFVMEINPRLTSSYIGLRQVTGFNVADAIVKAVTQNSLPRNIQTAGYCCFNKHQIPMRNRASLQRLSSNPAVLVPPFILPENNYAYTFIQAHADTAKKAEENLLKAKKQIVNQIASGEP